MPALLNSLERLQNANLFVLGDLILDCYTWGNVDRISPEAPVLVLQADQEETRLGGAASVAHLARSLKSQVHVAGVVGNDVHGRVLRRLLAESGVDADGVLVDANRPTTMKDALSAEPLADTPTKFCAWIGK